MPTLTHAAWLAACLASWAAMIWLGLREARPSHWLLGLFILVPVLFVPCLWALALWLGYPGCNGHPAARGFYTWIALYGLELMCVLHGIGIVLSPGRRKGLAGYMGASVAAYLFTAVPLVIALNCAVAP